MQHEDSIEDSNADLLVHGPHVSILMLVYNHGPYLAEAIESILAQRTDFDFEILIGEDHSTDDSRSIAEKYQRKHPERIRIITADTNVGMQANNARLIRASRAGIIAYCEGDDYWHDPRKLARQVSLLESAPDIVAVHSEFSHIRVRGGRWRALPRYWRANGVAIPQGDVYERLLVGNFIQTCTLVMRTEVATAYLDSDLPVASYAVGDWPLCLYAALQGRISYVDEPLATYRLVPGSATNRGNTADVRRAENSLGMISDFARLAGASDGAELTAHTWAMVHVLLTAARDGDQPTAARAAAWLTDHPGGISSRRLKALKLLVSSRALVVAYARLSGVRSTLRVLRTYRAPAPELRPAGRT